MLSDLRGIKGVLDVHHVHLWTITSGIYAMSAHVLIKDLLTSKSALILKEIKNVLHEKYSMEHTTIQFESETAEGHLKKDHTSPGLYGEDNKI